MKRILAICLVAIFCANAALAKQDPITEYISVKGTLKKDYGQAHKGAPVNIKLVMKISESKQYPSGIYYLADLEGQQTLIPKADLGYIEWAKPESLTEFWQLTYLTHHFYERQAEQEKPNDLRQEVEAESQEYFEHLNEIAYEDAYIASYVQGVLAKLCGANVTTNRNSNLNTFIIQSPEPTSFMLPGGNIIVSTGLLCTLDSEAELAAILASEIGHYLYDHQVTNVRRATQRAQRALFWADVFSSLAYSYKEDYYYDGDWRDLGVSAVADVGTIISLLCVPVINRLGMNYSGDQEREADRLAARILNFTGYPEDALTSALRKVRDYYLRNRRQENILRYNCIDDLQQRIEGKPDPAPAPADRPYLKNTYDVVNFNADLNYLAALYQEAIMLAGKNIGNRLADSRTYVTLVRSKMAIGNTEGVNNECLALLDKAEEASADAPNPDVCKQRILLLMRMQKQSRAINALHGYMDLLAAYKQQRPEEKEERIWIDKELNWAQLMIQKINKL